MRRSLIPFSALVVVAATFAAGLVAAPANAEELNTANAPALVQDASQTVGSDAVASATTVVAQESTAAINSSTNTHLPVVVGADDDHDSTVYTKTTIDATATQFSAVLSSPAADTASWDVGADAVLYPLADGRVSVSNDNGDFLAGIEAPWAVDAAGHRLKTYYTADGSVLTQHVEYTSDTVFPVVADPTIVSYPGYWVAKLNHSESVVAVSTVAACAALFSKSPVPALKALMIGCAVFAAYGTPQLANNHCLYVHVAGFPPTLGTWWPTFSKC